MGTRSYFLLMYLWKRHLHFTSFSVEWTVLAFLTHPNGSLLTPVIHFGGSRKLQGSFSCRVSLLGAPQEEKQRVVDGGGCPLCSSLFGSAGHVPSLRGILPELLRSFQAGERSMLWCALPNRPIPHADTIAWRQNVGRIALPPWLLPLKDRPIPFSCLILSGIDSLSSLTVFLESRLEETYIHIHSGGFHLGWGVQFWGRILQPCPGRTRKLPSLRKSHVWQEAKVSKAVLWA